MPNELDWTGTPQGAPLGQDGPIMQDDKWLLKLIEERAAGYGGLRKASLTANALDLAAATIARLSAG